MGNSNNMKQTTRENGNMFWPYVRAALRRVSTTFHVFYHIGSSRPPLPVYLIKTLWPQWIYSCPHPRLVRPIRPDMWCPTAVWGRAVLSMPFDIDAFPPCSPNEVLWSAPVQNTSKKSNKSSRHVVGECVCRRYFWICGNCFRCILIVWQTQTNVDVGWQTWMKRNENRKNIRRNSRALINVGSEWYAIVDSCVWK